MMEHTFSLLELSFFFFLYAFLGWAAEVACCAVARRRFFNRGFATLPLMPSYGITFVLLILVLPTLAGSYLLQFLLTLVIVSVVDNLSEHLFRRISHRLQWGNEHTRIFSGGGKGLLISALIAGACYLVYLIVHPLLLAFSLLLPDLLLKIVVGVLFFLLAIDLLAVVLALRSGDAAGYRRYQESGRQNRMAERVTAAVWRRLQRAYPGIREMDEEEQAASYTFAKGLCLDKLIWVFLISALLGDLIETFYCGLVDGQWMNRSSVLYGPFSFVWGLGAVVLTVTLRRLAEKNDRYVFFAGFFIGGAYEYMCSVFTELVFGTVFWDYSDMPLNIGGRTNVLFCFFWGVLAVVWIKHIYPPMSRLIEKLPALAGKTVTWVLVVLMVCNALLTGAAMLRYRTRAVSPEPANILDQFLDSQYGDSYMESHWPNMIVAGAQDTQD